MVLFQAAERRIGNFSEQELANTFWPLATADFLSGELFAVLTYAPERRIASFNFNAQQLVNIG